MSVFDTLSPVTRVILSTSCAGIMMEDGSAQLHPIAADQT